MYDFKVEGQPAFAQLTVNLRSGETIKAEAGAMAYMDGDVQMKTQASGGFFSGLKRMFTGESFFQNVFTGPGKVTFSTQLPGDIVDFDVQVGEGWVTQADAYMASDESLEVSSKWGGFKAIFGGEGAFLTHVSAKTDNGKLFLAGYGFIKKHDLQPGQELVVDTGIFFATQDTTNFKTSKVGGMKSFFFGGEGLVMRFTGPGIVYTQSRSYGDLISNILSKITT